MQKATVGEIFSQYKEAFARCSRGSDEHCAQTVEQVQVIEKKVVEVVQLVPPDMWFWIWVGVGVLVALWLLCCFRVIRPYQRCLVETLGKYKKTLDPGFHLVFPPIQNTIKVNMTERMIDIEPQSVITKDNLNATVDGILYYKVLDPRAAIYNVDDFREQLANLSRTTLRAVIGTMELSQANENRAEINLAIEKMLDEQILDYGVDVMRVEIQKVDPPAGRSGKHERNGKGREGKTSRKGQGAAG